MYVFVFDLHPTLLVLLIAASAFSLLLLILRSLGKEVETTGLVWIRAIKRLYVEWKKPVNIDSQPLKHLDQSDSENELDSGGR